ncbi:MAG TPA: Ku protein [Stellaceae bacterium]|jgi:Ku protein|nr:Ku protein [Stellaceae bacterium]
MAARANWKGVLKAGEVSCPVALYTAASTAERIAFHILNRKTGHRVHREFVDAETGERVEAKEQVKGYETGPGDYVGFEPEEIAKAVPEADKTLDVEAFVRATSYFKKARSAIPAHPNPRAALASAYALKGDAQRAATELAEAQRLSPDRRFSSRGRLKAALGYWGVPKIRALFEATLFVGLRKAGMLDY